MTFNSSPQIRKGQLLLKILLLAFGIISQTLLSAQTTRTVGSGGNFTTLSSAFTAINNGTLTGDIILQIISSTITETTTATLNASGSGSANYNSVTIFPTIDSCVIAGNLAAPLIDLNGARNVTIDGRVNRTGTAVSMTINNTSTAATAGTSTIRFINGASNNTVQYCFLRGATTSTTAGIIFFSTSSGTVGNHTNTITLNDITSSTDLNRPVNAIFSLATSSALSNNLISITNNKFYNFLNRSIASFGINFRNFTTSTIITGNSFYETTNFAPDANVNYAIITVRHSESGNHNISHNFIGGNAANCSGTWTKASTTANSLIGIHAESSNNTNNIHGNIIRGWSWSNFSTISNMFFNGIRTESGLFNIGERNNGNVIGSSTGNGSITVSSSASTFLFQGIFLRGFINCGFNIIGSITATNTDAALGTMSIDGIIAEGSSGTIHNNLIGSTSTENSINADATCTSNSQTVIGISISSGGFRVSKNTIANLRNGSTNSSTLSANIGRIIGISLGGVNEIVDNTIYNLTISNANTNTNENGSISGISCSSTSGTKKIWRNTIYNLSNTHASFSGNVTGIYGSTTTTGWQSAEIISNFIYGLSVTGANSTTARIYGINLAQGRNNCYNNVIHLGGDTRTEIFGISETGSSVNNNIYFNTIYLSGTAPSGATNRSYALFSNASATIRDFRNNILFNARSTTNGSGLHYAIFFNYSVNTNLTTNFNNYLATGTGGVIGRYAGANHTLASLRTAIGQDANSINVNPSFANIGGSDATDYKPTSTSLSGISIDIVNHDFADAARLATPVMGAFEQVSHMVEVWKSNVLQSSYNNLRGAFDALNSGIHHGILQIRINGVIWESETAVLNSSAGTIPMYSEVEIYPTIHGVEIRGNLDGPLIDFNGAARITIDGRVNKADTTGILSIINSSTSDNSITSTIRFINDANRITVQYSTIAGSQNSINSGVVMLSSTSRTLGNDNITFDNCNFTTAISNSRPRTMIYSLGSNGLPNDNLTISNSNFYDFSRINTMGINIGNFNRGLTIINNSFYERNPLNFNSGGSYTVIQVGGGNNFNIQGNYIGGTSPFCQGGKLTKTGNNNNFYAIRVIIGNGTEGNNLIQDNVISNIAWTNTGNEDFYGIFAESTMTIKNNTIGASTGTDAIIFNAGASGAAFYGIFSHGRTVVDSNRVGSIRATNLSTNSTHIYGLYKWDGDSHYYNNLIGSLTTANSIISTSHSTAAVQEVIGIGIFNSTLSLIIENNIVANLTNSTTNSTTSTAGLINGIRIHTSIYGTIINKNRIFNLNIANANTNTTHLASATGIVFNNTLTTGMSRNTVTNNEIYNIHNNNNNFQGFVQGISFRSSSNSTNIVSGNFIYNLRIEGSAASESSVIGIRADRGSTTYSNNIISIGNNCTSRVIGIFDDGFTNNPCNIYFNTIYIQGTVSGNNARSIALYSAASGNIRNYRNNILFNARSSDITGQHYAVFYEYATATNLTVNYNVYLANGSGGILARYAGNNINSLSDLRLALGQDVNSLSVNPGFAIPGGTIASDYKPSANNLIGVGITETPLDYEGTTRINAPTIGAFEGHLFMYVEVWESGAFKTTYMNLHDAFAKINEGVHRGTLELKINTSTIEPVTATLFQSGYLGISSYNSVHIYPIVSGLAVSGVSLSPLIDLNGADNVTIDGRVNATGTTKDMTIINTTIINNTSTTNAIRLINDASDNAIKYCIFRVGGNQHSQGAVFFSTTTGTTGNNNNIVEHNTITSISTPIRSNTGIFSNGTAGRENRNLIIRNNHFVDLINTSIESNIIHIHHATTATTIINNSIYQTTPLVPTATTTVTGINVSGGTHIIKDNFIGGTAPECSGTALTKTNNHTNTFNGILVSAATGAFTEIDGNKISNINWHNSLNHAFTGIRVSAGDVRIGSNSGNIIGDSMVANSIVYSGTTTNANFYGIRITSTGIIECRNNIIAGIRTNNLSTNASNIYGILIEENSGQIGQKTIAGNIIGSKTIAASIHAASSSTSQMQVVYGILKTIPFPINISNNHIANLTNGTTNTNTTTLGLIYGITSTAGSSTITDNTIFNLSISNANSSPHSSFPVGGIVTTTSGPGIINTVTGNTIYNLNNTFTNFVGHIRGIFFSSNAFTANTCSRNFIHSLSAPNSNSATATGIWASSGQTTYSNNIVSIGDNTGNTFFGFNDQLSGVLRNYFFNTLYIGGRPTVGTNISAALWSNSSSNTRDFRNNIFHNARSNNGASGTHYAAYYNYTTNTNLTNNFNNYFTTGTGGVLAFYNNANRLTLIDLQLAMGRDANSVQENPMFVLPNGLLPEDYKARRHLRGTAIMGFDTDFGNNTRPVTPQMGVWERIITFWKGSVSNDWNTAENWTAGFVPYSGDDIDFDALPLNDAVMDQNRIIGNLTNAQSTYGVVINSHKLTMNGDMILSNGAQIDASNFGSTLEFSGTSAQSIPAGSLLNNQVYNLTVNNANNVSLSGTLNILNVLKATNGRLNAVSQASNIIYRGSTEQTIENNLFSDDQVFNLTIDNAVGVSLNSALEVTNNMLIDSGKLFSIAPDKQLRVNGTLTNNAGTSGLVIASTAAGTGSLIHNTNNVPATVNRFIHGAALNWHFMSSPVSGQEISGEWRPPGTYADGTGYDLYVWDEPNTCWVYNLNNSVAPTWPTVHPQSQFVPGRGYLYAFQALTPTKQFRGNLNNGIVERYLAFTSTDDYAGFNYIGNPYPSSIDWKSATGFSRSMLFLNGDGYDKWIWNPEAGNYGVYNSADPGDVGTNDISRFIAPMQGFFVRASNAGQFQFNNNARSHTGASAWRTSSTANSHHYAFIGIRDITSTKSDEIKLTLNSEKREAGALKLFSHDKTAPSLYVTEKKKHYSVFSPGKTEHIDLSFKAGLTGEYVLSFRSNTTAGDTIILEDLFLNKSQDLTVYPEYRFLASVNDTENRFRIRFTNAGTTNNPVAKIYSQARMLIVDITALQNNYNITITDTSGKIIHRGVIEGGKIHEQLLAAKGVYFVHLTEINGQTSIKSKVIH